MANKKKVLVVEDERPLLEAVSMKLEKAGFTVVTAQSVKQARAHLAAGGVDAIWLDHYLLGKENGLDFVAELKSSGSPWRAIPIFVVSNTATAEKVQSYIRFGITKYYVKAEHRLDVIVSDVKSFLETPAE